MEAREINFDAETGMLTFELPVHEVKPEIVDRLNDAGIINLNVNYRHFTNMGRGDRTYYPDIVPPPFVDATMEKLVNGSTGYAQLKFGVSQKAQPDQAQQGKITIVQIAKALGFQ